MNNPARRLHSIIQDLKKQPNERVDVAFAKALNVDPEDYTLLIKRIGLVFTLVDASKQAIEKIDEINHEIYLKPIRDVSDRLREIHLVSRVNNSSIHHITDSVMAYLDMTAEYLTKHLPEPTISNENRKKILNSIHDLWKETKDATEMPDKLRYFIFDKLDLLRRAVEIYDVSGATPVQEASESIIGSMFFKFNGPKQEKEIMGYFVGKLFKCAITAYCSIEVANNVAQLPESFEAIACLLGM